MIYLIAHRLTQYEHLNQYWKEAFESIGPVEVIEGPFIEDGSVVNDAFYKNGQFQELLQHFKDGVIRDGDIIFFTDAWDHCILTIAYLRAELDIDVKMFGFWGDGISSKSQLHMTHWKRFYRGTKNSALNYAKRYEKSLIQALDHSFFKDEQTYLAFRIRYFPVLNKNPWSISGYPYSFMKERAGEIDYSQKEDIIIFPWEISEQTQYMMFEALKEEFPEWRFVTFIETEAYKRGEYLNLLKKAKIMFCADRYEADMSVLYEGMCYGVWPFIPNGTKFRKYFDEKYRYPKVFAKNMNKVQMLRSGLRLSDILREVFDNYENRISELEEDRKVMEEKFFNTNNFLEALNTAIDGNTKQSVD